MKKLLLAIILVVNVFALDELSAIGKDEQDILDSVIKKLNLKNLSSKKKTKLYKKFSFTLKKDWYVKWWDNGSLANANIDKTNTQFLEMVVVDESSIFLFTFMHFQKEQKLITIGRQLIDATSSVLLKNFKEYKNNDEYKIQRETNNYGYLTSKEYADDVVVHIKGDKGIIGYFEMTTMDLQ